MQRVVIVGLGLIGGSIGLGLRRWSAQQSRGGAEALQIIGFDTDLDQQAYAKKISAVDKAEWRLPNAVADADLVVLATPVRAMQELLADITPHLKAGAVVTDVGSTKADVLRWADEILPESNHFVGGHPMAGKSTSIEGADPDLFKGATWCIAPSVRSSDDAVRTVLGMVAALDAEAFFVDPVEHDAYVAGVSHLPFVLAAALTNALGTDPSWKDMKSLTAGGFKDMTRLAAGSPAMHRDILLTNRAAVVRWLDQFQTELAKVKSALVQDISEAEEAALTTFFESARDIRADWSTQVTREGELIQKTGSEMAIEGIGDQMSRMFFGNLFRRRMAEAERLGRRPDRARRAAPADRDGDNRRR